MYCRKHTEIQVGAAVGVLEGVIAITPLVDDPELGRDPYIRELTFNIALNIGACHCRCRVRPFQRSLGQHVLTFHARSCSGIIER